MEESKLHVVYHFQKLLHLTEVCTSYLHGLVDFSPPNGSIDSRAHGRAEIESISLYRRCLMVNQ